MFADKFGWTPNQVDEQPAILMDWLLAIANASAEAQKEQMEKVNRQTESKIKRR